MAATLHTVLTRCGWEPYRQRTMLRASSDSRALFIAQDVKPRLDPGKTSLDQAQLAGVIAKLNRFVQGKSVTVSTPNIGGAQGDLKALKGYEDKVFQMRFYEVAPQLRMLGVFPQKDVFLGAMLLDRSELDGKWGSAVSRLEQKLRAMGKDRPKCICYQDVDEVLTKWRVSI